ncbi:DNA-binding winged helix-turn-helix (wHTH) protein [Sagittula marina]|uniref:DNA-binding winged helix-turn-helix (WHTH) protein n=1 Tax=Sagittula marina TaxID=943940 RepID=A0A7W6GTU5_9RHOB|nr:hypothetical protein [Sagittula marina]MBB3986838.1 DNA-binding winged helix-turn-helix (wHTH) protein [Sagittula marina]
MPAHTTSVTDSLRQSTRLVTGGVAAIIVILSAAAGFLFLTLPDGQAFNDQVAQLFANNDALQSQGEVELLMILAQSGTAFADVLASYRMIILVLMIFAAALLAAALVFVVMLMTLNRRMAQVERSGIEVSSLIISREERTVYLNTMGFKLTDAMIETMSVLAEARLDDELLTGAQIEAMISGRDASDCEEAAGATRIKRLRDGLGNQMVSELLVKNIARKGYVLAIDKGVIEMV